MLGELRAYVLPPLLKGNAQYREAAARLAECLQNWLAEGVSYLRSRLKMPRANLAVGTLHNVARLSFPIGSGVTSSSLRGESSWGDEAGRILLTAIETHLARSFDEEEEGLYISMVYSWRNHWLDHWGWGWHWGRIVGIYERGETRLAVHLEMDAPCGYDPSHKGEKLWDWNPAEARSVIKSGSVREVTYEEDPPF